MSVLSRITPDRAVLAGMLAAAAVYCRDLQYDFILDDVPLILMNETITSWKNWGTLFISQIFPGQDVDVVAIHYRPIYTLWLMLNYRLFGMVLPWWHLSSLLLHLLAMLLVYKMGLRVSKEPWTAALAAILFGVHPIHVESVSYVSASTDLLAAIFMLLGLLAYCRFRERGASLWYLSASALTATLAMLSKETGAVFPMLLVAYEATRKRGPESQPLRKQLLCTLPFFLVVAGYSIVRTLLFGSNFGPGPGSGVDRMRVLWDAPLVLLAYLRNLLWPTNLSFYYPDEWVSQWTFGKGLCCILALAAGVILWQTRDQRTVIRLQLLWTAIFFFIPLASVSALRTQDWVHDRHMYLVSVPFCLLTALLLANLKLPRKTVIALTTLVATALLVVTAVQVPRFKDEISIYQSALKVAPRNVLARRHYAAALWDGRRRDQALREFRLNIEMWPELPLGYQNYAGALEQLGRDEEAEVQYKKALAADAGPTHFRAAILYRVAGLSVKHSNLEQAETCLREALAIDPKAIGYHTLLAQVLIQQGREQSAREQMELEANIKEEFVRRQSEVRDPR